MYMEIMYFTTLYLTKDGCQSEITNLPSPSGDPNLNLTIVWPETDIGQKRPQNCPCGPDDFPLPVVRQVSRTCGGTFEGKAIWKRPDNISTCEFSDAARRLCNLALVSVANT